MHCPAIEATDAPFIRMFNNKIQAKQVPHNAGVGGSSPPVATKIVFLNQAITVASERLGSAQYNQFGTFSGLLPAHPVGGLDEVV